MSHSSRQVAEMVKCSRPSLTDVVFVAMDALAARVGNDAKRVQKAVHKDENCFLFDPT